MSSYLVQLLPADSSTWLSGTILATLFGGLVLVVQSWKRRPPVITPPGVSRDKQALPVKNQRGVFKSGLLVDNDTDVVYTVHPEATTLYQMFLRGMERSENNKCLGRRAGKGHPYTFISYAETFRRSRNIGSAFIRFLGVKPGNNTLIGIYGRNSPEWTISCLACIRYSMVTVPLYDTLGADAAKFIVQQTQMQVIVVDEIDKIKKLISTKSETPSLEHVVLINESDLTDQLINEASHVGIKIHTFEDLLQIGETDVQPDLEPKPLDKFIICYTSGTTGTPKGVVLSHQNLVANVSGVLQIIRSFIPSLDNPDHISTISYLPLSHMFEQVCHWSILSLGGSVGYYSGDVRLLSDDMKALKPTIFPTVPRLLNRFHGILQKILDKPNFVMRYLFRLAYYRKLSIVRQGIIQNDSFWDKLVFNKVQEELGGNLKLVVTGSAPISGEALEACRVAFGCHILEGYGQTECTAMATVTWPYETTTLHCGGPAICTNIKLADVPELNYFSSERKGEVMIKGPSVTSGYFNDPEKTAELFDEDGYLHTGDIGHLLPNGTLRIIDRKKHIFKLAQGEYVAPEKIENVYVQCPLIQQVYVDGDSVESYLVSVVVPDKKTLLKWYKNETGQDKSLEEVCNDDKSRKHVLAEMIAMGKTSKLNSIEQVKAVHLEPVPFSVENGFLTPTFKSKRPQLRQRYQQEFKKMYKETS